MLFNPNKPKIICLDINSCFATIEQQANPLIRNMPVVVAAYTTDYGCILAASVTAKKLGIKTGMRVIDAKKIDPKVVVLPPDPHKYRFIHKKILKVLKGYSPRVAPKSIDEFVLEIVLNDPWKASLEIKERIKKEIGEYITVSIGISTNRYLAKVASNRVKPDGLVEINKDNFQKVFSMMKLTDLTGIKKRNEIRLKRIGVNTVLDFYNCPVWKLKIAFGGIGGLYWYTRLHGYEIDDFRSVRKTYGNSYAPPLKFAHQKLEIISKLCQKTGFRLRKAGLSAQGVHLSILFRNGTFWHKGLKLKRIIFESSDIYKEIVNIFNTCPTDELPRIIAINVFNLTPIDKFQLSFLEDVEKKLNLSSSIDSINKKWGDYTVYYARMSTDPVIVQDRIAFGNSEV